LRRREQSEPRELKYEIDQKESFFRRRNKEIGRLPILHNVGLSLLPIFPCRFDGSHALRSIA